MVEVPEASTNEWGTAHLPHEPILALCTGWVFLGKELPILVSGVLDTSGSTKLQRRQPSYDLQHVQTADMVYRVGTVPVLFPHLVELVAQIQHD